MWVIKPSNIKYVMTLHYSHIGRKEEGVIYHQVFSRNALYKYKSTFYLLTYLQVGNHRNRLMLRFTACGSLHEVS